MNLSNQLEKAKDSGFRLWLLNRVLKSVIPFNAPHGLKITEIRDEGITVKWPYRRSNLNHIKGLHACGIATLSEFCTGISLLRNLDPSKYRIIMKTIRMDYHYQGKMDAFGQFDISQEWLNENVLTPIEKDGVCLVVCEIRIHDKEGNHLATGNVEWQVKSWDKVKTKVA